MKSIKHSFPCPSKNQLFPVQSTKSKLTTYYRITKVSLNNYYTIQCVDSKSIFKASLVEIICDGNILSRLSPLQACYIGIEYTKFIKNNRSILSNYQEMKSSNKKINFPACQFKIKYRDRKGYFYYTNIKTNEEFIKEAHEIAFCKRLIEKFTAEDAFYIGQAVDLKSYLKTFFCLNPTISALSH